MQSSLISDYSGKLITLLEGSILSNLINISKDSLKLIIFTDLSFANNYNLLSQIGFIITLTNKNNKANIIYWLFIKCKQVTQSVLAFKLYKIAYRFDTKAVIKITIKKIL